MSEKVATDEYVSHDEKNAAPALSSEFKDTAGRKRSVALNIVENPLKVSFPTTGPVATSCHSH